MKVETKQDLIQKLSEIKPKLQNEFGVLKIGIFGSFAKDQITSNSDIDVLVEMKNPDFDSVAGLQILLEKLFERNVDLIRRRDQIKSSFLNRIQKDLINV
ncbi:nucleotidyltransferase domain protein [Leptospira fainei serovar Hurstbridge str. BUT 6]|uniref:Nucleotidyltransferase domain protein n=1 Tax=Leptospira fainei serovar Hurstbridge str. BUT 6 TaxID=1193011 RepID=S3V8N1_9LEPT|nr:nucleotidyltransferase domain-containing protein [Leptospira fainei]EPG72790.1 nucleotidyltransferase domain protein [Leptospira fainei serovar Hurstbridge str. BUT 6]